MKMNIIRNKMGKKAVAALLAVMIMSAPVTNVTFAPEGPTGDAAAQTTTEQAASPSEAPAPVKPEATSHNDNNKVQAYNAEVDKYNASARQYNDSVDKEYNDAVEETNRMNEEIDQHNAAEQQRVNDAKERNAQAGYYNIILMDIQMPVMDGYEATRQIRALEDADKAAIPIVAVTANAFEEDRKITMEAGMNGHLSKPYDVPAIMKTMNDLMTMK